MFFQTDWTNKFDVFTPNTTQYYGSNSYSLGTFFLNRRNINSNLGKKKVQIINPMLDRILSICLSVRQACATPMDSERVWTGDLLKKYLKQYWNYFR